MTDRQTDNVPKVEVCPRNGMRKEEMIKHFHSESVKYEKSGIWPYAKYEAELQPDICIGNCEKCNAWDLHSEKEVYIRENNTFINHVKYELGNFIAYYMFSLPLMLFLGWFIGGDIAYGFIFSFLVALIYKTFGLYHQSFEKYLGEKYESTVQK